MPDHRRVLGERMANQINPPVPAGLAGAPVPGPAGPNAPQPAQAMPLVTRFGRDCADWPQTPLVASVKLRELRRLRDDAAVMLRSVLDEQQTARDAKTAAELRLRQLKGADAPDAAWFTPKPFPVLAATHPELVAVQRRIETATAEIERLAPIISARSHQRAEAARRVENIERYFSEQLLPLEVIPLYDGPDPELRKGETPADAIERARFRIRELNADAHRVRSAPWPVAQAKQRARREIEEYARVGAPNCLQMVEAPNLPIGWKRPFIGDHVIGGRVVSVEGAPDATALIFWLHRDLIIARIDAALDAIADDEHALTLAQRSEQMAVIERDKLAIEREEEAAIIAAGAAGLVILRRPDCDVRAVLGLSDDLPAPSAR